MNVAYIGIQLSIFALSLVALALASHFAIKYIEKLIELTGLSEVSAGFIILAVMTSTPEIIVALFSILQGKPGISVGDVFGSNVFNIGVVVGILAMLGYLKICSTDRLVELTDILFLTSLIPLLLVIFKVWSPVVGGILFGVFLFNIYFMAKKKMPKVDTEEFKTGDTKGTVKVFAIFALGMACVFVAADLVVSSGIEIAMLLGAPPILVGAKVIAIGTSLPELTLDFAAVRRGRVQLAIGDIIGSNLTNLTLVLGLVLVASPFAVDITIFVEILPFLLITTIIFWRFLTRGGISQVGGVILIFTYILFQAILFK
ncbi:MAG: sodium:calcium antiporter [Candidatus Bathyarchaeia archaeon]